MSRSKKGRNLGTDYWGKRARSRVCRIGPLVKKATIRAERGQAKQALHREDYDFAPNKQSMGKQR